MIIPRGHKQTDEEYRQACMDVYRYTTIPFMLVTIGLMAWGVYIFTH